VYLQNSCHRLNNYPGRWKSIIDDTVENSLQRCTNEELAIIVGNATHGGFLYLLKLADSLNQSHLLDGIEGDLLCIASGRGWSNTSEFLIIRGADFEAQNRVTPLYNSARFGHHDIAKLLLECGAEADALGANNRTPIQGAIYGHWWSDWWSYRSYRNRSPEEKKSYSTQSFAIVGLLIAGGASLEMTVTGEPLIHLAIKLGFEPIVKLLLRHGADVEMVNDYEHFLTPLATAIRYDAPEIAAILLANGASLHTLTDDDDALVLALRAQTSVRTLETLIDFGADVNRIYGPDSPLTYALRRRNPYLIDHLLKAGAKQGCEDRSLLVHNYIQQSPFDWQLSWDSDKIAILDVLIKHGADISQKDCRENTPLLEVCQERRWVTTQDTALQLNLLLEAGASVSISSLWGLSPLRMILFWDQGVDVKRKLRAMQILGEYNNHAKRAFDLLFAYYGKDESLLDYSSDVDPTVNDASFESSSPESSD